MPLRALVGAGIFKVVVSVYPEAMIVFRGLKVQGKATSFLKAS